MGILNKITLLLDGSGETTNANRFSGKSFENADGQTDDGRTVDTGCLSSIPFAYLFSSGELILV